MLTRRHFIAGAAGFAATKALPMPAIAQARPRVVVVGGGAGGLSVLRRLAADQAGKLDITLVEPQKTYTTCFYSNLYLGGIQPLEVIQHNYMAVAKLSGVRMAADRATAIDRDRKRVTLAGGETVGYDRLVLSPGIGLDYDSVPGWSKDAAERMPHAWQAGPQTRLLKKQLDAVPDGGLIVIIAPPNPYRCPPGPYERVSMMAHALKMSGRKKTRIVIVDPKDKFSKQALFQQGWERHYPGMIEWLPPMINGGVKGVDPSTMSVTTGFETYKDAALVNVIPRQTAGKIAVDASLAGEDGYCPIDPFTMKSVMDDRIFILGDACVAGDMPKSAFAAHSQAQVVAHVVARDLLGTPEVPTSYANRCWSLIESEDSVVVGGEYQPTKDKILQTTSDLSALEDTPEMRRANYEDSAGWYSSITLELFG